MVFTSVLNPEFREDSLGVLCRSCPRAGKVVCMMAASRRRTDWLAPRGLTDRFLAWRRRGGGKRSANRHTELWIQHHIRKNGRIWKENKNDFVGMNNQKN